jgi:hypothetical protein
MFFYNNKNALQSRAKGFKFPTGIRASSDYEIIHDNKYNCCAKQIEARQIMWSRLRLLVCLLEYGGIKKKLY